MPLFLVQDSDRPVYVVAADYSHAVAKWQQAVADENEIPIADVGEPDGINRLCDDCELIVGDGFVR